MRMQKYTEAGVQEALKQLPEWKRTDMKWMERRFRFAAFMDSIQFVNEVARIAESMNHHPMIAIDYRVVTLRLTTWKAAGLTHLDMESALAYDQIYTRMSDEENER